MSEAHEEVRLALDGKIDGESISPSNVDILTYGQFFNEFTDFVQGEETRAALKDSKVTSENGSLMFVGMVTSTIAANFHNDLKILHATEDLDSISPKRAKILETWQRKTKGDPELSYSVGITRDPVATIRISNEHYFTRKGGSLWTRAEKYISGKVVDIGGKNSPNIHVVSAAGNFKIGATEAQLRGADYLYHDKAFNVLAEEHLTTGELKNIQLIEVITTSKDVDETRMQNLWSRGREAWRDVLSPSDWVDEQRGHKLS